MGCRFYLSLSLPVSCEAIVVLLYIKEQPDIAMTCIYLNVGSLRTKNVFYRGAKLYNALPEEVKDIENTKLFKKKK